MQGMISTYLADKGYGFIKGEDRKDHFFRKESSLGALEVGRIADEVLVTSKECVTPKGYRANRLSLASRVNVTTFVLPERVMTSRRTSCLDGSFSKWAIGLSTVPLVIHRIRHETSSSKMRGVSGPTRFCMLSITRRRDPREIIVSRSITSAAVWLW
jgi:hypothetical protein